MGLDSYTNPKTNDKENHRQGIHSLHDIPRCTEGIGVTGRNTRFSTSKLYKRKNQGW